MLLYDPAAAHRATGITMRRVLYLALPVLACASPAHAYIEAPHSLGKCVHESTNIVLVELSRVSKEKNLLIFKKERAPKREAGR